MRRHVLYCLYQDLHNFPPCIAEICMLRDMGIDVTVLTGSCADSAARQLAEKGVTVRLYRRATRGQRHIRRCINATRFLRAFFSLYRAYGRQDSVLWLGSEQTAVFLLPWLSHLHPTIVNALEFYETRSHRRSMTAVAARADILTAREPHRAQFMVDCWHLRQLPYVLRNKPYGALPPKGSGSTPELHAAIEQLQGKQVLLYQGDISGKRDLRPLARALQQGSGHYDLVLYGRLLEPSMLDELSALYDNVLYLGYFPAPSHLEITPYATIAVAYYTDDCLNNRYCAPNKIHEYAGFGIPMLCNPLPGLTETVGAAGAAQCVDFEDAQAVNLALDDITAHYDAYRQAALAFYDSVDNTATLNAMMSDAFSRLEANLP